MPFFRGEQGSSMKFTKKGRQGKKNRTQKQIKNKEG